MMVTEKRLIDADAEIATVKENVCRNCNSHNGVRCRACWVDSMIGFIDEAPTVDAVEVVHGRWRYYSTTMQECSNCQRHTARHKFKYCPHCGAIMEDKYHESTD